jgi:hypothetical protein
MDKSIIGLIGGAATALIAVTPALAAPVQSPSMESAMQASSYADLLKPIPNAGEILKASAEVPLAPERDARVQQAQLNVWIGPRHPHYRRWYHHHHHHHHHHHT